MPHEKSTLKFVPHYFPSRHVKAQEEPFFIHICTPNSTHVYLHSFEVQSLGKRKIRDEIFTPDYIRRQKIVQKDTSPTEEVCFFDVTTCGDVEKNPGPMVCPTPIVVKEISIGGILNGYLVETIYQKSEFVWKIVNESIGNRKNTVKFIKNLLDHHIRLPFYHVLPTDLKYFVASQYYINRQKKTSAQSDLLHPHPTPIYQHSIELVELIYELTGMPKDTSIFSFSYDHENYKRVLILNEANGMDSSKPYLPYDILYMIKQILNNYDYESFQQSQLILAGDVELNPGPHFATYDYVLLKRPCETFGPLGKPLAAIGLQHHELWLDGQLYSLYGVIMPTGATEFRVSIKDKTKFEITLQYAHDHGQTLSFKKKNICLNQFVQAFLEMHGKPYSQFTGQSCWLISKILEASANPNKNKICTCLECEALQEKLAKEKLSRQQIIKYKQQHYQKLKRMYNYIPKETCFKKLMKELLRDILMTYFFFFFYFNVRFLMILHDVFVIFIYYVWKGQLLIKHNFTYFMCENVLYQSLMEEHEKPIRPSPYLHFRCLETWLFILLAYYTPKYLTLDF